MINITILDEIYSITFSTSDSNTEEFM